MTDLSRAWGNNPQQWQLTKPTRTTKRDTGEKKKNPNQNWNGKVSVRNEVGDVVFWDKAVSMNKRYISGKMSCHSKDWGKNDALRYRGVF